jgi:hypothetical protein
MKKINITQYALPDPGSVYLDKQLYCVYTGFRNVYFGSEVKAKRFLNDANRLLNYVLHSSNFLYYNLFAEYRKAWFYMENNQKYPSPEEITNIFLSIDKSFNWLIARSGSSMNGNINSFRFLEKILIELLKISIYLSQVNNDKNRTTEKHIIEIYINQINELIRQLKDFGKGLNTKYEFIKENNSN